MTAGRRRRRRIDLAIAGLAGIAVFAVATSAVGQPPSGIVHVQNAGSKSPTELGSELYAANCASCHGIDGAGIKNPRSGGAGDISGAGPDLRGVGALAADFYLKTGRMPLSYPGEEPERASPVFSPREIHGLTAYIASLGKGPAIPRPHPERGNVPHGQELYTEHCAGCHQAAGEGGFVTGARVPVLSHATDTQIAEAVRIGPFLMPRFSRQAISDHQLNDIVAYVESLRSPDDAGGLGIGHIGPVPEGIVAWFVAGIALVGICILIGERLKS
jgi:ubiquinol-cytochrome c reductase cytochrome c subunit